MRSIPAFGFRAVEGLAGRPLGIALEVLPFERFRDLVLLLQPLPQINQSASLRTEWSVGAIEPESDFAAGGAFIRFHATVANYQSWGHNKGFCHAKQCGGRVGD